MPQGNYFAFSGLIFMLASVFPVGAAASGRQQGTASVESHPSAAAVPYDRSSWKLIKQVAADVDGDGNQEQVLLLESLRVTGDSGIGLFHDVDVLIGKNGKMLYDYVREGVKPEQDDIRFFLDGDLDIRDVTGDSVPEIIFDSGFDGASDYTAVIHIIRYDKSKATFRDVSPQEFVVSGEQQLRWLDIGKRALAVIAHRNWDATPEFTCHYCNGPYLYDVYEWSSSQNSFVKYKTLKATREFGTGTDPLDADWMYIEEELRSSYR